MVTCDMSFELNPFFTAGNRSLTSFRILTVYLTLAALLFSNFAGWVHVGCSNHHGDHHTGCCSPASAVAVKSAESDRGRHSCCCHHHGSDCTADTDTATKPESDPPTHQHHDSDRCAVCQNFFASRHAVTVVDAVVAIERIAVSRGVAPVDDVFAPNHLSPSHTVRGPPSV